MKHAKLSVMGVSVAILYFVMMMLSMAVLYLAFVPSHLVPDLNRQPPPSEAGRPVLGQATVGNIIVSGAYVQATTLSATSPTALATISPTLSIEATMSSMDGMKMGTGDTGTTDPVSSAYLLIQNRGNQADKLISITCDAAGTATLHQTVIKNDIASMQMLASLDIPASSRVELKPGGYHIMLMSLNRPLVAGQTVRLTLTFASGVILTLPAPIVAP